MLDRRSFLRTAGVLAAAVAVPVLGLKACRSPEERFARWLRLLDRSPGAIPGCKLLAGFEDKPGLFEAGEPEFVLLDRDARRLELVTLFRPGRRGRIVRGAMADDTGHVIVERDFGLDSVNMHAADSLRLTWTISYGA